MLKIKDRLFLALEGTGTSSQSAEVQSLNVDVEESKGVTVRLIMRE